MYDVAACSGHCPRSSPTRAQARRQREFPKSTITRATQQDLDILGQRSWTRAHGPLPAIPGRLAPPLLPRRGLISAQRRLSAFSARTALAVQPATDYSAHVWASDPHSVALGFSATALPNLLRRSGKRSGADQHFGPALVDLRDTTGLVLLGALSRARRGCRARSQGTGFREIPLAFRGRSSHNSWQAVS
jgi:hypothetical protein